VKLIVIGRNRSEVCEQERIGPKDRYDLGNVVYMIYPDSGQPPKENPPIAFLISASNP
jgi:hypothetical protein